MRVADLRSEVGLPVTSGPGALQSPLPAHVLRKHHRLLLSPAPPARNTGPLRPSPLSLKALRPAFANGNHYNHAPSPRSGRGAVAVPNANTASPRQRRPMKMRLPALPALDSSSAAAVENHSTLEEQFKIERKLEAAIYGCVLKAHRRSDGKAVAIKVLSKEHIRRRTSMKDMPVFENAEVELSVLQKSAECPHPNVLRSLAAEAGGSRDLVLHDAKHIYCITPFCDNGELFDAVRSAGGLPAAQATRLFAQIARGVHHLHTRLGYVHNDISPENILLRSMRRVGGGGDADPAGTCTEVIPVLTDFGLAAEIGRPAPRVPGKVSYQAPEVLYGGGGAARPAAASSDVFSLGVLFFVMLTGVLPYDRPQTSDPKFAALQEGAGVFGAAAAEWDVAGCTALVAEHPRLLRLICAMTRADADARPTLDAVMSALESGERPLDAAATGRLEVLPATVGSTTAASATNTPKTAEAVSEAVPGTAAPPTLGAVLADQPLRGRLRRKQRRSTGQRLALQQSVAAAGLMSVDDSVLPSSLSSSAHSSNGGCGGVNDDDDTGGGVTSDEEGGCSLSPPVPAPAAGFAEWRHRPVDTGHPLARQHQQHRRCSTFLASPSPTLGVNSPSGVADIAFMSLGGAVTATPAFAGFAAAAHEVTARALLSSSCSRSSSGSNNKKQHASEQRQHNRRRRRQHNRPQQTPSLAATMSPTTSSSPPSLRKRRATKASPTAAAPPSTPGLLQHVLQRGIQLEKFRASED